MALALMAAGGPDAITLRAIAREMGMTANAIYGYFATRDDLVTALIEDVHTALADAIEAAWNADPAGTPGGTPGRVPDDTPGGSGSGGGPRERIRGWARAFRGWALANPQGFRLVYGDPVPGYRPPEGGAAPAAAQRVCLALTAVTAAAWPWAEGLQADSAFGWSDFDAGLLDKVRPVFPELPPAGLALALRLWGRLHGLVALEVYGHLQAQTARPDALFEEELTHLLRSLGLETP
ncbi:putative TetR-family transcriptional regulator [Frankia canadensis]|uniref:Putative TetR-family transcriptional regulator n=1 Tax=Frankia canadensis TaxID=1836972 RepID=A0A2I2KU46_9ACTN|nr:putative TetR-family transcriptional regulator [Frankia canadensis]SOU56484.1 putative TetR-family transcriptional regulator [Frankia canadensis]